MIARRRFGTGDLGDKGCSKKRESKKFEGFVAQGCELEVQLDRSLRIQVHSTPNQASILTAAFVYFVSRFLQSGLTRCIEQNLLCVSHNKLRKPILKKHEGKEVHGVFLKS